MSEIRSSKDVSDEKVSLGQVVTVPNTKKRVFSNAKDSYNAVWITDTDGNNERCWLLTDKEVKRIEHRSRRNKEDWTKRSFWDKILNYKLF